MNNIGKSNAEIAIYLIDELLCDFIAFTGKIKNLFGLQVFCVPSGNTLDCGLSRGILGSEPHHCLFDCTRGGYSFQMPEPAAGTLGAILLDQHMPDLSRHAGDTVMHFPVYDERPADATPYTHIENDAFPFACALLYLSQGSCICVVINYTGSIKS